MNAELLPIDKLVLDLNNPRIARMLAMYDPDTISAEQISLALGAGDSQPGENYTTFFSLKESIRTHGGLIHPIIVNRESDGKLVVIEGNTRTQIYREFVKEGLEGEWTTIPAIVHDGLPPRDVDAIRLQAHLVGPRPWDPYSKAKYLDFLRNSKHLTFEQIVEFCGGRRRQVHDYIAAYHDMETHYRQLALESGGGFDVSRFSAFVELQKPNIQQAVVNAGFGKDDFSRWVIDGLLSPLQTVRSLPSILANDRAREVFLEDGAQEAAKVLDVKPVDSSLEDASLSQLARELTRRIVRLGFPDIQRLKADPLGDEREVLVDAHAHLEELFTFIVDEDDV